MREIDKWGMRGLAFPFFAFVAFAVKAGRMLEMRGLAFPLLRFCGVCGESRELGAGSRERLLGFWRQAQHPK